MKKFIKLFIVIIAMITVPFTFSACGGNSTPKNLSVSNVKIVFDIGENFSVGDNAQIQVVQGENVTNLASNEYSVSGNFNSQSEGVYDVSISAENQTYSYKVVVIDHSILTVVIGQATTLADIELPSGLNLAWNEPTTELSGEPSTNYYDATFVPDGAQGTGITVSLPVTLKRLNLWMNNFPTIENWTYGETPVTDGLLVTPESGSEVTYEVYTANEDDTISNNLLTTDLNDLANLDAGDYYVVVNASETDEYIAIETSVFFTVQKAVINITANDANYSSLSKVYDGSSNFSTSVFGNDFYNLTCNQAINHEILSQIVLVVRNARFVTSETNPTENATISATAIELEVVTADDEVSQNFTFENSDFALIYFEASITKADATIAEDPTAAPVVSGENLSTSLISGGVVQALLSNGTVSTQTNISGTWSWQSPTTTISQEGSFVAVFTPNDTSINEITCELFVQVIDSDNITATIETDSTASQQINRYGNTFQSAITYDVNSFNIQINTNNLSANYQIYLDGVAFGESSNYVSNSIISFDEEMVADYNTFTVLLIVTDTNFNGRTITLTITKEQVLTMFVNGTEQPLSTTLLVGDEISFVTSRPEFEVYLNNSLLDQSFIISEEYINQNIPVSVKLNDNDIFSSNLKVQGYFESLIINDNQFNINDSNINFEYLPDQNNFVATFLSPYHFTISLQYRINEETENTSVEGYTISVPLQNLNKITIDAIFNDEVVFTWEIFIQEYEFIESFEMTCDGEVNEADGTIIVQGPLETITVNLFDSENYYYEWYNEFNGIFEFENISTSINTIKLRIYNLNDMLVTEQTFTLYYQLGITLNDGNSDIVGTYDFETGNYTFVVTDPAASLTFSLGDAFIDDAISWALFDESGYEIYDYEEDTQLITIECGSTISFQIYRDIYFFEGQINIIWEQ